MKKHIKKLTLNRETLHNLGNEVKVAGGAYTDYPRLCSVSPGCTGGSVCYQCASYEYSDCVNGCTGTTCA